MNLRSRETGKLPHLLVHSQKPAMIRAGLAQGCQEFNPSLTWERGQCSHLSHPPKRRQYRGLGLELRYSIRPVM